MYNPPMITPVGTGGLPAPVQQGATIYQPAVYQQMPPLSQPGQMLYSPPVVGPYVAGSAGPSSSASSGLSASTSAAYLSPGALPPSSRPSRPRLVSTVAASSVHYVAPSAPTLIAAPTAPEQEVQHLFFICYLFVFICIDLLFIIRYLRHRGSSKERRRWPCMYRSPTPKW